MFALKGKSRTISKMSEVKEQSVKWLWYPYIAFGKITVLHGLADSGKSIFVSRLMAACTNHNNMEGMEKIEPVNVLYFTADDDLSDMVRPRLLEAGAELSRIYVINDMLPFTLGDDSIGQMIEDYKIGVMIADPIQEYLEYDVYKDEPLMTYPIIHKLEELAKSTGCAVILNAYSDGPGGTQGNVWKNEFAEKISSVLCLERQGMESKEICLHHEKCTLAPEGRKRMFRLDNQDMELFSALEPR